MKGTGLVLCAVAMAPLAGCVSDDLDISSTGDTSSFEDFKASVYREPGTGIAIVNGDEVVANDADLFAFWQRMQTGEELIVNKVQGSGADDVWTATQKRNITYCVSDKFGTNKPAVVAAMDAATAAWEGAADVNFVYKSNADRSCNLLSPVVFRVKPITGAQFVARSFFPSLPFFFRDLVINSSAFDLPTPITLPGVVTHELGHVLGFRHEHTRPEAGTCFEDNNWRELTPYDRDSTMHYPQCNGNSGKDLTLTDYDRQGVARLYGAPR